MADINAKDQKLSQLKELLDPLKGKDGKFPNGYLRTEVGKKILGLLCELQLSWKEIVELLQKRQRTIENAFNFHDLHRISNHPDHLSWSPERLAVVEKYCAILSNEIKTREDSRALRRKMHEEVNGLPGPTVTIEAIRHIARNYGWKWVWQTKNHETPKAVERAINLRIEQLIGSGLLAKGGLRGLYQKICEEFPGRHPSWKMFKRRIQRVLWEEGQAGKQRDRALQEVVRMNLDPRKDFHPRFPNIPFEFVAIRTRWHRGIVSSVRKRTERAMPGIGRVRASKNLGNLSTFKMPQTSFATPYAICPDVKEKDNWTILFLNGANIGTRYGRDIVGNVVRRALSDADERGDKAVILTNIISLDLKKAGGPIKVGRGLVMGDNINPNIFADPEYRREVESIVARDPKDEIIYQNSEERLDNVLSGWHKITHKPNNRLEFRGSVFIILGINEEELINAVAYWEIHYWTKRKQAELTVKLTVAKKALKEALLARDFERIRELEEEIDTIQERYNRTVITNVATQELQRFHEQARALVVRKIEQAIPNARVIGQSNTFIEIGGRKIEVHIPSHEKVTDALLARFAGSYGPKNLREHLAPVTVICHPWSLQYRMTVREADYDGKRGSAKVFVAPIAVDDDFLRHALRQTARRYHPLARTVFNDLFSAGVLRLQSVNGVIDGDPIRNKALERFKEYPTLRARKGHIPHAYDRGPQYIWVETGTDQHWGGRAKEFVTCRLPGTRLGMRLGMSEAVFEMQRHSGLCGKGAMRVHIFTSNDDGVQGQNYHYRTEADPHQQPFDAIEQGFLKTLQDIKSVTDPVIREAMLVNAANAILRQIEKRGSDHPHEQIFQMINRHVIANNDIFRAILERHLASGIILKGVGDFGNTEYGGYDSRNVGAINFPSGNHLGHTIEDEILEGPIYAAMLVAIIAGLPEWAGKGDLLRRLIAAPIYGSQTMAWGTVKTPGGYEYGLDFRATPPRMSGWADPLRGAVNNDPQRGNYARIYNGRFVLKTYGDKHFFAGVMTSYAFYHMCASGTHTDPYGERGFPPNNTGVSFVGLPADGPDSGPILLRIMPFDVIKDFVEDNPRPFNWEEYLPNPV